MDDVHAFLSEIPLETLYNILRHMNCKALLSAYGESPRIREALPTYDRIGRELQFPLAVVLINNIERAKLGLKLDVECEMDKDDSFELQVDTIVQQILRDMQSSYSTIDEAFEAFKYRSVIVQLYEIFREELEEYMLSPDLHEDLQDIILFLIEEKAPLQRLKTEGWMPTAEDVVEGFETFVSNVYSILYRQRDEGDEVQPKLDWFREWTSDLDYAGFDSDEMFEEAEDQANSKRRRME